MNVTNARQGRIDQINKQGIVLALGIAPETRKANRHYIKLVDCSGSMSSVIHDVSRDVQKFVAEVGENDFVSVIIFSGHGRAKVIAGPTRCDKAGRNMVIEAVKQDVRILDTTVFSEPLELALKTVQGVAKDCENHATLFTDGCAVPTKWDVKKEQAKAADAAKAIADTGAGFSVIGYGTWYDAAFLANLMSVTGSNGLYRHISEIEDFSEAMNGIRQVFEKTVRGSVDVTLKPSDGKITNFVRITPEVALTNGDQFRSQAFFEGQATLFVETTKEAKSITIEGRVNGKPFKQMVSLDAMTDDDKASFIRAYAAQAALSGETAKAAEYLEITGDDGLAEKIGQGYTAREQREGQDMMRRVFTDGKRFIGKGLKPSGPNHSVLNVLRVLIEDKGNVLFIPQGAYKRGGELVKDPRVVESPNGRTLQVFDLKSNNERFNFSLLALKDIDVLPVNEKGEIIDNGKPEKMQVFRSYNVIRGGELVLSELEARVSQASFNTLLEAGVIKAGTKYEPAKVYSLNLRDLKMISPAWAKPAQMGLVGLMKAEEELEVKQKALNARKKQLVEGGYKPKLGSESSIYAEKGKKDEERASDTYDEVTVEYRMMGYKPKDFDASKLNWEEADAAVKETRRELSIARFKIRAITFAMERCKQSSIKWGAVKTTSKGTLEQLVEFDGAKLKRAERNQTFVCS